MSENVCAHQRTIAGGFVARANIANERSEASVNDGDSSGAPRDWLSAEKILKNSAGGVVLLVFVDHFFLPREPPKRIYRAHAVATAVCVKIYNTNASRGARVRAGLV